MLALALQDWADGSVENAVILIARLVKYFDSQHEGFKGRVFEKLTGGESLPLTRNSPALSVVCVLFLILRPKCHGEGCTACGNDQDRTRCNSSVEVAKPY